jgi:geranylgeranyl diphosphate synthase type 3
MKDKGYCEDLTEGKFSYPIIHCVKNGEKRGDTKLLSILRQKTEDVEVKKFAQALMREAGSLEYTRRRCTALKEEVLEEIEKLGGHEQLSALIGYLDEQIEGVPAGGGGEEGGGKGKGDAGSPPKSPPVPTFSRIDSASN